jgi:hypothetical protein
MQRAGNKNGVRLKDSLTETFVSIEERKNTPTGNALNVQIGPGDVISNIPVTIDFDHHQIHEGEVFRWSVYVSSLAQSAVKDIRLVVPNINVGAENPVKLCPHLRFEVVSLDQAYIAFYESSTFTGNGTSRTPIALERNGTYTPKLQIYEDPSVNAIGNLIWQGLALGSKNSVGGIDTSMNEFVLKNNTSYFFRVTNGANASKILIRFIWYEDLGV